MATDTTALAVYGSTAVVQVDCNPFPTWYDVRPDDNASLIYGMDVKYACREAYAFIDGSEDTEKSNTCNSNGLWNEFIVCEEVLDEEAEEIYWTAVEAPGAEYYGYSAIAMLSLFLLLLIILDMDIWYYSLKPVFKPVRRLYRRMRRWCRQKCHKDGYDTDSDDSSSDEDEPVDPVERFKMQFQKNQRIILPMKKENQEQESLISEPSSNESIASRNKSGTSLKVAPAIITTDVLDGKSDKGKTDPIRNSRTPDIIRDARIQMKMDWQNSLNSPRRERTISINSSTIQVEINAQSPLPGQSSSEDLTPDPFSRRSSIVSMRNESGARNKMMETSFGRREKFPDRLTPPEEAAGAEYSNEAIW